ncbi:MAG: hypothetical protein ACQETO_09645 [Pseudomonadota bacterium]
MVSLPALIVILLILLPSSLWLSRFAGQQQEHRLRTLQRLGALERRRGELESMLEMFQQLGAGEDILEVLQQALLNDLRRMQRLDPRRRDLDGPVEQASKPLRKRADAGSREQAAVRSEQELSTLRHRFHRALELILQQQRQGLLSREDAIRSRHALEALVAMVGVNSYVLMARNAQESGNTMKAFSLYRKAERLSKYSGLTEAQQRDSLSMVEAERQQLLQRHENDRGLMLLASGE